MKKWLVIACLFLGLQPAFANSVVQKIPLQVTEKGFEPSEINVKPGTHVILQVTRKTDATCATKIRIAERKILKSLPLNKEVSVDVGILEAGEIRFACGMDMVSGHIIAK